MTERMQHAVAMAGRRLRRNRALDADGAARAVRRDLHRAAALDGTARRVEVSADGEVLAPMGQP